MGSHPLNLGLRFILEVLALVVMAVWGWQQADGVLRIILAIGLPLIAMVVWGVFNVPDDSSRSGKAPVVVPGIVRLLIELALFALATWLLFSVGQTTPGIIFAIIVVVHYALSYDRIAWLLGQR